MLKQKNFLVGITCIGLALSAITRANSPAATEPDAGSSIDAMANQFDTMKKPTVDRSRMNDAGYARKLLSQWTAYHNLHGELAIQLLRADPEGPKAKAYLQAAIDKFRSTGNIDGAVVFADEILKKTTNPDLKIDCLLAKVDVLGNSADHRQKDFLVAADAFIAAAPKHPQAAEILAREIHMCADDVTKKKLTDRLLAEYPDSPNAKIIRGTAARMAVIGKPFDLTFNDAIGGKKIDIKDLRGKVVVIDFWATWCTPCVGEMPNMKKLYATYRAQGVEFLGISLDEPEAAGGLKKLKDFCAANQITWPQYYQGNGWQSDFSVSWGISSIPTMFVVDADGNVNSIEARGQLEKLLPALIAKRDAK